MTEHVKVKRLYKRLFGEDMPKGWRFYWGIEGVTIHHSKHVFVRADCMEEALDTVIHELIHVRYPNLPHGKRFQKKLDDLKRQVVHI